MQSPPVARPKSAAPAGTIQSSLHDIEARLERLERALQPLEGLAHQAPAMVATVGDITDEWAKRLGDMEARVSALTQLVERLTRPQTIQTLGHLVDLAEDAPNLVATMGDVLDETMADAAAQGLELTHVADDAKRLLFGLLKLTTSKELRALLDSGMLDPKALQTLGMAAQAVAAASDHEPPKVGMFGALKALRGDDTQRALGFLLDVAVGFGRALKRETKRLGS